MTDNSPGNRNTILVTVGIIAVFLVFLLTLIIPFGAIFLFILAGVVILMVVVLSNSTPGSQQKKQDIPKKEPETPSIVEDRFELILIAIAIGVMLLSQVVSPWLDRDRYVLFFLYCAGVIIIVHIVEYFTNVRTALTKGQPTPNSMTDFYLPIARKGLLLIGAFICSFLYFEIWRRYIAGQSIPGSVYITLIALFFIAFLYFLTYLYLKFCYTTKKYSSGNLVIFIHEFLIWLLSFFFRNFNGYILAAILLNGSIALVVLLAANKIIDLDLLQLTGLVLLLVFFLGNCLIFALVAMKLHKIEGQPMVEDWAKVPKTPGGPQEYLNAGMGTIILQIFMVGFIVAVCVVPFLAIDYVVDMSLAPTKDISITVEHPEPSQVAVVYNGGKDAGSLVVLEASIYNEKGYLIERSFLGSDTSISPIKIGQRINFTGSFPAHPRVRVSAHFSDGKKQVQRDSPI